MNFDFIGQFNGVVNQVVLILIIIVVTLIVVKIQKILFDRSLKRSSRILKVDPTHYRFLKHFSSAVIYIIGLSLVVYVIPSLRSLSISLLAGAGILAVVIGFASQHALSNIVSGIFIVIFKPFRVGDRIKIGTDPVGVVEDITLRHTVLKTFENKRVMIPNSVISNEKIENSSIEEETICKYVEFGVSYDSNIKKAKRIMKEESEKHPNVMDNRTDEDKENGEPIVTVRVIGFTDSSVVIRAWVWAKDPTAAFKMGCDLNESIKERFDKEKIEIPFPYRTVVYKNNRR